MSCFVCGSVLKEQRTNLTICEKRECKKRLESLVIGDYVVKWLRDKTELAHFHLMIGYKAFQNPRWKLIAHPYPVYFNKHKDLLDAIIPLHELFKEVHDNDVQLAKRISESSYILIKFILMTAPPLTVVPDPPPDCKIFAVRDAQAINEPVYHGSGEENWYSIIRNGLKSCSGTAWQQHGASFGNGIYLGKTIGISAVYSSGDQIIGVYKWLTTPTGSTGDAYVVPDNTCIQLQFIVVSKRLTTDLQCDVVKTIKKYRN